MTDRLLDYLRCYASRRGLILTRGPMLQQRLGCSFDELERALATLRNAGRIEILSPLPFLVLALLPRPWSSSSSDRVPAEQQISRSSDAVHIEVPVSSSAAAATQQSEDGGVGEGEALLDEVLDILGPEADRDEFRTILAGRSPVLIYRCLQRVRATRAFRVSRAALFRSLLQKLNH